VFETGAERTLAGASVRLLEANREARTDEDGHFAFADVEPGAVTLRVSLDGYVAVVEELVVSPAEVAIVRLEIDPLAVALAELFVTGTSDPRQSGRSETLIPGGDHRGRTAADLLAEAVPGLDLRRTMGSAGAGASVRLRGARSLTLNHDAEIYVDGVRITARIQGFDSRSSAALDLLQEIPASSVERIRVLRGPAAAAQYPDASNGVILIETRKGAANLRW
jgi:outer membrane receptor protein involved in Fe transport